MTASTGFYSWAVGEGLAAATPFSMTTAHRMADDRLVEVTRNAATLQRVKPHVRIKYLEDDFAELFCRAPAGLGSDGLEDCRHRGRFPGRNSAMGHLVVSSGLRRQEFSHLLVHEIPPLPTEVPVAFPVAAMIAKGRKARTTWIDYAALATAHNCLRLERPIAASAARWQPARPLVVEEPDLVGVRTNGHRTRWASLTPAERRRLVDAFVPIDRIPLVLYERKGQIVAIGLDADLLDAFAHGRCGGAFSKLHMPCGNTPSSVGVSGVSALQEQHVVPSAHQHMHR